MEVFSGGVGVGSRGMGVGSAVASGVGAAVGSGVGVGVGSAVGSGVGLGVAVGSGVAVTSGSGVAVASALILLERVGKAVRSPAKSVLLARMAETTGRGRGFGVHKALDQVGAFAGPLLLAGVAAVTGALWPGLALLAVPGAVSLLLLAQLRRRVPSVAEPGPEDAAPVPGPGPAPGGWSARGLAVAVLGAGLPREFHLFSLAVACATAGPARAGAPAGTR